jgi:hypothetical protein
MTPRRDLPLAALAPMTLAAAGCAPEPFTAADFVSGEPPAPQSTYISLPTRDELVRAWQLPPGDPWAPYEKFTLPASLEQAHGVSELPDVGALEDVRTAKCAAANVAAAGLPSDAMWVVDLRGAASVAFGSELSRRARPSVAIVPTFNNWPADRELVPAEETLAAMIAMPPRASAPGPQSTVPVFLLDAWRLAYKDQEVEESIVDNRYMLSAGDLPSPEALRSRGIGRVVYVVEDRGSVVSEEDDLNDLFQAYQNAGIGIDIVDLAWLCGEPVADPETWWARLGGCQLSVSPRVTVIHDRRFYLRARGGFGGVHARPFAMGGHGVGHAFGGGAGGG